MMLLMTMMRTGKIVGGVLICHRMDTVEMKDLHMMENREDAAAAVGVFNELLGVIILIVFAFIIWTKN